MKLTIKDAKTNELVADFELIMNPRNGRIGIPKSPKATTFEFMTKSILDAYNAPIRNFEGVCRDDDNAPIYATWAIN
jgi:hypothetical protein